MIRGATHPDAAGALPWLLSVALAACGEAGGAAGDSGPSPGPAGAASANAAASAAASAAAAQGEAAGPGIRQSLDPELKPAFALANAGDFDDARSAVAEYLRQRGEQALRYQAEFLVGYAWQKQKVYASASEHLLRATEIAPGYAPPWHFLGFARYYLGDLPGARAAFEAHLRLLPGEGDSEFGLGLVALDEDRLDEAERAFRRAIELHEAVRARDPAGLARLREVAKARARLADVLARREQWPGALEQLEEAARLWPGSPDVWHKLHDVRARLGDEAGAAQALRRRDEARAQLGSAGAASEDAR